MFGPPGHLYVYFTYGMHYCANVVTAPDGGAGAVLLRGALPLAGEAVMRERRGGKRDLCGGPAKLCQSFGLGRSHNGIDLCSRTSPVRIVDDGLEPLAYDTTRRVGLVEGRGDDFPWRFVAAPPTG
jgi:DNA-3-methyladenine glycosylase